MSETQVVEVQTVKKKKKIKKKMTPFLRLLCYVVLIISGVLLYEVVKEIYTTVELRKQIEEAQLKYEEVKEEASYLTSERDKLTDPNYVQSYARGTYMLSKDGEQIFYLPEKEDR